MDDMKNIDTYIDVLNTSIDEAKEEVAKLSSMVAKLNDKIKEVEAEKEQLIKEQNEPKFELTQNEKYFFIDFLVRGAGLAVQKDINVNALGDRARENQNNCFKTKERAEEVLNKIKLLLKLERLHDIYCPDYKPDWDSLNKKYFVYYSHDWHRYIIRSECNQYESAQLTYFPTAAIAQKVRDILNEEEQDEGNRIN